jgi:hypothetical protein
MRLYDLNTRFRRERNGGNCHCDVDKCLHLRLRLWVREVLARFGQ